MRAAGSDAAAGAEHADWWNPILRRPLELREGLASFAGVIGSGVEFNEEAVQRYLA